MGWHSRSKNQPHLEMVVKHMPTCLSVVGPPPPPPTVEQQASRLGAFSKASAKAPPPQLEAGVKQEEGGEKKEASPVKEEEGGKKEEASPVKEDEGAAKAEAVPMKDEFEMIEGDIDQLPAGGDDGAQQSLRLLPPAKKKRPPFMTPSRTTWTEVAANRE